MHGPEALECSGPEVKSGPTGYGCAHWGKKVNKTGAKELGAQQYATFISVKND